MQHKIRHAFVCLKHKLLYHAVCLAALPRAQTHGTPLLVQCEFRLRKLEIHGSAPAAHALQHQRQLPPLKQLMGYRRKKRHAFAGKQLVYLLIGAAAHAAYNRREYLPVRHPARFVYVHKHGKGKTVAVLIEGAYAV